VLSGHTSFVYSVALLPSGEIVSGGEDRSVRVWKGTFRGDVHCDPLALRRVNLVDGECSQVIVHPAISVWAVSAMPNGDIVSGSSDGVIRVFSEHDERWADAEDLKVRRLDVY
jgi:phospholipase A-2-activating protein